MDTDDPNCLQLAKDKHGLHPWLPITNPQHLKRLGKLAEECGELSAIIGRIIIQGIDARGMDTSKSNQRALEDECADVLANITLAIEHFHLNVNYIKDRQMKKEVLQRMWQE